MRGPPDTEFQVHPLSERSDSQHVTVAPPAAKDLYSHKVDSLMSCERIGQLQQLMNMLSHAQGGIYHGRILLPPEYPFKPPSFLMLSPTGRFETNVKICLSISSHHPEHWQPSWSVRTALTALIAFFPTPGNGAIGSLVCTCPYFTYCSLH